MKDIAIRIALLGCLVLSTASHVTDAAPVPPAIAEKAARAWMRSSRAPGVRRSAAVKHSRRVSFRYDGIESAANLISLDGGGFVVVAPDDRIEPVIFHSPNGTVSETDDGGPFWALMKADMAYRMATVNEAETGSVVNVAFAAANNGSQQRELSPQESVEAASAKWADLLADEPEDEDVRREILFGDGVSSISDVRVAPLLDSSWGQSGAGGDYCYNYYTPEHCVCGCVATSVAQLMRYHRYPTEAVSSGYYSCTLNKVAKLYYMTGGPYSWSSMPGAPTSSMTIEQRKAIGRLCSDVGIACEMDYTPSSSGASSFRPVYVLKQVFKYSNVLAVSYYWTSYSWTLERFKSLVVPNCDAGLPVLAGVPGHAIVADGYGYDNSLFYVHLNMGWNGKDNLWYNPPTVNARQVGYSFSGFDGLMANIYKTQSAGSSIASGRVFSSSGSPVSGATVKATCSGKTAVTDTTDANGIYGLVLPAGQWTITATSGTATGTKSVTMTNSSGATVDDDGTIWSNPPSVNNLYEQNITLSAPQAYTISFNANGGSPTPSSITRKANEAYGTLPTPTRTGYTLVGWYTAVSGGTQVSSTTKATASVTLYAHWTANTYSVKYALDGGAHGTTHPDSRAYDSQFLVSAPTRTGYTFAGWTVTSGLNTSTAKWGTSSSPATAISSTSTKCKNGTTGNVYFKNLTATSNGSVTLTANWTKNTYSIAYALNSGTHGSTHPTSATYDTAFYVSAPTRTGYTFAGWTVTSGLNTSTAKWGTSSSPATAISSTSTKCVNGATGNVYFKNLTATSNGSVTLTANWTAIATVKVGEVQKLDYIGMMGGTTYVMWLENSTKGFLVDDVWLEEAGIDISGGVTPEVMNAIGRNGIPRYESLLLGLDPESSVPAEEQLHPTITFDAAGKPVISCFPRKESELVTYTELGKRSIGDAAWEKVTDSNRSSMKFFKVKVELNK